MLETQFSFCLFLPDLLRPGFWWRRGLLWSLRQERLHSHYACLLHQHFVFFVCQSSAQLSITQVLRVESGAFMKLFFVFFFTVLAP